MFERIPETGVYEDPETKTRVYLSGGTGVLRLAITGGGLRFGPTPRYVPLDVIKLVLEHSGLTITQKQ